MLARPFAIGDWKAWLLDAGDIALDGGAMFGVVPKTLWSKRIPADEQNRIVMCMRSILVEHPSGLLLVEAGLGDKEDAKFHAIYGVANAGTPTRLEDAIRAAGYAPEAVEHVVLTHLHFDHAGGITVRAPDGGVQLAFPNARCYVQRGELDWARHTNERTQASYLPHNYEPVDAAGRFTLLDGDGEILPGVSARVTPGHCPWHQTIVLRHGGETVAYLGDLIPTQAHLPLPWIMGYDVEPLRTLESRRALLAEAARERWTMVFDHDAVTAAGRLAPGARGVELLDIVPHRD